MPISDLTNTTWVINASVSQLPTNYYGDDINYNINNSTTTFKSITKVIQGGLTTEVAFRLSGSTGLGNLLCFYTSKAMTSYNAAIDSAGWYRRVSGTTASNLVLEKMTEPLMITITSGTKTTDADLIAWLEANAEQVVEPAAATFSSFKDISYNAATKALTINGASYTLAETAVGTSVAGGSFSQLTLTSEGVLTIDGVSITLPVYAPVPDHSIVDNTGGYILNNSAGYLITTERSTTLTAPTISLADTTLSIVDEDGRSMTYDIYVNDSFARNIEAVTGSTTTFDLENLGLGVGAHIIKAKAKASSLGDSNYSNEVTYTLAGDVILDQFTLPDNITDFEFIYDA